MLGKDQVLAKGKGDLSTYWIVMRKRSRLGSVSTDDDDDNSQQSRDDLAVDVVGRKAVSVNASTLGRQLQSLQSIGSATTFTTPSVRSENRSVHCYNDCVDGAHAHARNHINVLNGRLNWNIGKHHSNLWNA
jgi:hypothetical protein